MNNLQEYFALYLFFVTSVGWDYDMKKIKTPDNEKSAID